MTDIGKGVKNLVLVYILDNLVSSQKKKKSKHEMSYDTRHNPSKLINRYSSKQLYTNISRSTIQSIQSGNDLLIY